MGIRGIFVLQSAGKILKWDGIIGGWGGYGRCGRLGRKIIVVRKLDGKSKDKISKATGRKKIKGRCLF
tara:strand:- start:3455 stop:3658 length:204 start_codon:yes stop_codon:yes gene_type:complete